MAKRFEDRVVWITGGGTGIGRAMALEFAQQGAAVAVSGRRPDRLEETVQAIEAAGGTAWAVVCDVCDDDAVAEAVSTVVARRGRLDVAVANAGYGVAGRVEDLDANTWTRQLMVNVVGVASTVRHALPHLRQVSGRVALVGSVAGYVCPQKNGAYNASKAAVHALGETLSAELAGTSVSCTTLVPGFIASEIGQVDNAGVHNPNAVDKRPAALMWQAEDAAKVMIRAIHRRKREAVITGHGQVAVAAWRWAPSVVRAVMRRT